MDLTSVLSEADPVEQVALAMELVEENKRKFDRMEHAFVPERTALRDTMRVGSKAMATIVEDRNDVRRALLLVARIRAELKAKIARLTLLENELLVHFAGLTERQNAAFRALDSGPAVIARVLEFHGLLRSKARQEDANTVDDFIAWCASRGKAIKGRDEVLEGLREGARTYIQSLEPATEDRYVDDEPGSFTEAQDEVGEDLSSDFATLTDTPAEWDKVHSDDAEGGHEMAPAKPDISRFEEPANVPSKTGSSATLAGLGADAKVPKDADVGLSVPAMFWYDLPQWKTGYEVLPQWKQSEELPSYDELFLPPVSTIVDLAKYAQIDDFDPMKLALWDDPADVPSGVMSSNALNPREALAVARKAIERALETSVQNGQDIQATNPQINLLARFWTFAIVARNRPELIMTQWDEGFFVGVRGHHPVLKKIGHFWIKGVL
ncbi:hypothetical protein AAW00_06320 [Aurantiacibacter luteus]|uniref:Uncharacterized protein n=2 Tax=Aurantiacibacter luteus TaxID=1581420 RepID=A0A0G9MZ29_9SPHN|nr:hypothetical protein AAW00_06320 [Aurantiacibacter luteus]